MSDSDSETGGGPVLVVSCSLNPSSRSHLLALAADAALDAMGARHDLIDLRDWDLPICDGAACYDHPSIGPITDKVAGAGAILIAAPVYNYDLKAAAKNLVELTGARGRRSRSAFSAPPAASAAICRRSVWRTV